MLPHLHQPHLHQHHHQRRMDVVTPVVSNSLDHSQSQRVEVRSNVSDSLLLASKLAVPTTTSITTSISTSTQKGSGDQLKSPSTLTLPFTPNLFGMMSYVQALRDIKRSYQDKEWDRKVQFHNKDNGDLMTRILRTLIHKVVNKYQKKTELLKLQISKRTEKLQKFLQLPMVSQVVATDQQLASIREAAALEVGPPSGPPSYLDAFLI